jgi:hypothetical protein
MNVLSGNDPARIERHHAALRAALDPTALVSPRAAVYHPRIGR